MKARWVRKIAKKLTSLSRPCLRVVLPPRRISKFRSPAFLLWILRPLTYFRLGRFSTKLGGTGELMHRQSFPARAPHLPVFGVWYGTIHYIQRYMTYYPGVIDLSISLPPESRLLHTDSCQDAMQWGTPPALIRFRHRTGKLLLIDLNHVHHTAFLFLPYVHMQRHQPHQKQASPLTTTSLPQGNPRPKKPARQTPPIPKTHYRSNRPRNRDRQEMPSSE